MKDSKIILIDKYNKYYSCFTDCVVCISTFLMEKAVYNATLMLVTFFHAGGKRVSFESSLHYHKYQVFGFLNIDSDILTIN